MEEKYLKYNFSYTDEFGQESNLNKTLSNCVLIDSAEFEVLVEEFKLFLKACGFSEETINTIKLIGD